MELGKLIDGLDVRLTGARAGAGLPPEVSCLRICDITEDSRTVVPGSLFIARSGLKADGKQFIEQAIGAGAVAILADAAADASGTPVPVLSSADILLASARLGERFYGDPSRRLKLALVTGTNGKTTTTTLIWRLLNGVQWRCGLIGTVCVDDGSEVATANMTTPPSIEISRTLERMVDAGCGYAAIEASSHALDQRRVDALKIDVGIFTNLTGDHLDYHKTMEAYAAAKSRLFTLLDTGGVAIVNGDDAATETMVRGCRRLIWRCGVGRGSGADCRVVVEDVSIRGMQLTLAGPWGEFESFVPMVGTYNAMNVLQAVAVAHAFGLGVSDLVRGAGKILPPAGRLERVGDSRAPIQVFVDYAHSDDSLRRMLEAVGPLVPGRAHPGAGLATSAGSPRVGEPKGRLWVVFGCGGDRDKSKRARMGAAAAEFADLVVVTSDNPRSERPGAIIDEILAGVPKEHKARIEVQVERELAIRFAVEHARDGDVIVIAGKGHETYQILPDGKGGTYQIDFDDRAVARQALAERFALDVAARATPKQPGVRGRGVAVGRWGRETGAV